MRKIVLLCAQGMSTGMLMNRMRLAASAQGYECEIKAYPISRAKTICGDTDCILIGPQVRYELDDISKLFPNKLVFVIDNVDYGRLNGEKVIETIRQKLKD